MSIEIHCRCLERDYREVAVLFRILSRARALSPYCKQRRSSWFYTRCDLAVIVSVNLYSADEIWCFSAVSWIKQYWIVGQEHYIVIILMRFCRPILWACSLSSIIHGHSFGIRNASVSSIAVSLKLGTVPSQISQQWLILLEIRWNY